MSDADKDFSAAFSRRLEALLRARFGEAHGWKTKAQKATIGRQLDRYLSGSQSPTIDQLGPIAAGIGCNVPDLFDFDGPIPGSVTCEPAESSQRNTSVSELNGDRVDFDFFGPRWKMTERGLARFTDTPEKLEAFVTALIRNGAPLPQIEALGLDDTGPPGGSRRKR